MDKQSRKDAVKVLNRMVGRKFASVEETEQWLREETSGRYSDLVLQESPVNQEIEIHEPDIDLLLEGTFDGTAQSDFSVFYQKVEEKINITYADFDC